MNAVTLRWLVTMLRATSGPGRDHGKNLEIIRSLRDGDAGRLSSFLAAVVGGIIPIVVVFVGLLYQSISDQRETGSISSVQNGITTVMKTYSEPGFSDAALVLVVVLAIILVTMVVFIFTNRRAHASLNEAYADAVELYFLLSRQIP